MSEVAPVYDPAGKLATFLKDHKAEEAGAVAAEKPAETPAPAPKPVEAPAPKPAEAVKPAEAQAPKPAAKPAAASMVPPADVLPVLEPVAPEGEAEAPDPNAPPEVATDPKARSAWTGIKKDLKAKEKLLAERDAELARLREQKPPEAQQLEEVKTKLAEAEDRIGQLDIVQSKAFQQRYDQPLIQRLTRAQELLKRAGVTDAEQMRRVTAVLVQPDAPMQAIQDAVDGLPMGVQGALVTLATEMSSLQQERISAIQQWRETRPALSEQATRASTADMTRAITQDTLKAADDLAEEQSFIFIRSESNQEWNTQRDQIINAARTVLREGKRDEIAKYVMDGVAASRYRAWGAKEHARAEKLQAELNKLAGVALGVGGGGGRPAGSDSAEARAAAAAKDEADRKKPIDPTEWLGAALKRK